jgi:diguanylate cyclase (GGDEF)-like protein/putative nucleotidyltransferase with HDIG domain
MKAGIPPSSLFWNTYFTQTGLFMVPVFLLHFSYVLIKKYDRNRVLRVAYVLSFILITISWTGNVVEYAYVEEGIFYYGLYPMAYVLGGIASGISLLAFVTMIKAVRMKAVKFRQVQLVIVALGLVVLGGAININEVLGQFAIDIIFNGISAILITYSIYRNKFLEINLVVKKGLYYSIYNFSLFALYSSVIVVLYNLFQTLIDGNTATILFIMSPVFLLLEPVRRLLQKWTDNLFYRANTDRQIILNDFSSLVNSSFSLDKINSSLLSAIHYGINSKEITILLKNSTKYKVHETSIDDLDFDKANILFTHPIVKWFEEGNPILLRNHIENHILFKQLWDAEKKVLETMHAEVMVPIYYLDQIIGLVVISGREDELPYSDVEIQFLQTLLNNAAAIIENAKTLEILKRQSITDELTKLYNHRYFFETVNTWIKDEKYNYLSVAYVDIDQFKIYNDLYGHSAGDNALKKIASLLEEHCPKETMLVRYGGEEFGIVYPNYKIDDVAVEIEKIRQIIEDAFLLSSDIREFLTVSVGAAVYPDHGSTLEEVSSKAFDAVKICKQSGRNKSLVFDGRNESVDAVHEAVQEKIREAYLSSTYALAATIDAKDHYTYGHSNNVAELSVALAKEAGFTGDDLDRIKNAGLLHDIGKVGIPEHILLKKGYLTDSEFEIMRSHVVQSINIIKHIPNLVDTIPIIISHHERFDGKGYPRGIAGENIPVLGRVICIADAFDAMTTDRPYRKGLSVDQALFELQKHAGTQFDPDLVEIFISLINSGGLKVLKLENRPSY